MIVVQDERPAARLRLGDALSSSCQGGCVSVVGLNEIEAAVRSAWCLETCDQSDVSDWSPANPARGQCGVTALTLHDLLGGELLLAEVLLRDGSRQGFHWWNRLAGGLEVDLTREQFVAGEVVQDPRVVTRPPGLPRYNQEQYLRLREHVHIRLGLTPAR